jgi:hypothetical protein
MGGSPQMEIFLQALKGTLKTTKGRNDGKKMLLAKINGLLKLVKRVKSARSIVASYTDQIAFLERHKSEFSQGTIRYVWFLQIGHRRVDLARTRPPNGG